MQHRTFVKLYHIRCSINDASPSIIECGTIHQVRGAKITVYGICSW